MQRYFNAFESGTLTGRRFAGRVEELEVRLAEARRRRDEIQDELERETVREPSQADLRGAIGAIAEAMESGTPSQRMALLQELVSEIRVDSRGAIFPTAGWTPFRVGCLRDPPKARRPLIPQGVRASDHQGPRGS